MSALEPGVAQAKRPSLFGRMYAWIERSARHPRAEWILVAVCIAEASFFPIPPDVMLAPMALERPRAWLRLGTIATLASVVGGIGGWFIGHYLIIQVLPLLQHLGYGPAYETTKAFFAKYGVWAIIVKGATPIPYKIVTITAGAVSMPLLPFVLASFVGRGMRFYLVAGAVRLAGPKVQPWLAKYIDVIGWVFVGLLVAGFLWFAR
ncbi:MAG: DedA family protein [Nevskia sp.]|nr:DedA family protein [Nevskia sp.]